MPFSTPSFFRHRNSTDTSVHHPPSEDKTRKLRKRPHFHKERDTASLDLSNLFMGNKASLFNPAPLPPRPRRPAATDLPNLPSLPIYQSFTAKSRPTTILDNDGAKPPIPEKSASRRSSISSRMWPLPVLTRGRSSERTTTPVLPRQYSNSVDTAAPGERGQSLPRYDRASYLAESYRALLPDINSADQKQSWDPREPRPSEQTHPALHHLGNRALYEPTPRLPEKARPWLCAGSESRPSSAASSSTTAVGEDHSPVSDVAHRRWSVDTECLQYATKPFPRIQEPQALVHPLNRSPPLSRQRTSDDVGLQICSDMLNAELRKSLVNRKDGSKLQFLLLIEAYEATLESCRKEISRPPLTRGGEGEIARRKHFREAVRILNHWLDTLYTLYDEEFGEDEGTRGSMI